MRRYQGRPSQLYVWLVQLESCQVAIGLTVVCLCVHACYVVQNAQSLLGEIADSIFIHTQQEIAKQANMDSTTAFA